MPARALMCIYCMYVQALFTASWKASKTWNDKHSTDFCLDHLAIPSPTMDSTYIDLCWWKAFWSPALKNCHGGKEKPRASACPNIETARTCEHLKGCSWAVLVQATPTASKRRQQELPKHRKFLQDEIITVYLITQMTLVTSPGVQTDSTDTTEIGRERTWWNWSCHQVQPTQSKRPFSTYLCESSRHGIWCQSYVSHNYMYSYPTLQSRLTFAMFDHISHDGLRCPALHSDRHGARRVFPEPFVKTKWKQFFVCILNA